MCKICQSKIEPKVLGKATLVGDSQFDFVVCPNCGTGYLTPAPSSEQLQALYGPDNFGSNWFKQRGWGKAFAKLVLAKKAPGKFLDVFCTGLRVVPNTQTVSVRSEPPGSGTGVKT